MTAILDAIRSVLDGLHALASGGLGPAVATVDGAIMCLLTRVDSQAALSVAQSSACI